MPVDSFVCQIVQRLRFFPFSFESHCLTMGRLIAPNLSPKRERSSASYATTCHEVCHAVGISGRIDPAPDEAHICHSGMRRSGVTFPSVMKLLGHKVGGREGSTPERSILSGICVPHPVRDDAAPNADSVTDLVQVVA